MKTVKRTRTIRKRSRRVRKVHRIGGPKRRSPRK